MEPTSPSSDHEFSTGGTPTDWRTQFQFQGPIRSPTDSMTYFQFQQHSPAESATDDFVLWAHSGDTSNRSTAADPMEVNAAAAQGQPVPQLVGLAGPTATAVANSGLSQIQVPVPPLSSVGGAPTRSFTGAGTEEMMQSGRVLPVPGLINTAQGNAGTHTVSAEDVQAPVVNAALAHQQPYPYSTGDTRCCSSTAAADTGSRSPDLEVKAGAAVRGSRKREKLVCGSSRKRATPQFNLVELEAGLVQSDPSSADIEPPTGSTDIEIIRFLKNMPHGKEEVNLRLGELDGMAPKAVGSYVTTVAMMPDQKTHLGYWKQKQVEAVGEYFVIFLPDPHSYLGLKRTFQFHNYDGTKTNWFMDEYIPTSRWGIDLHMESLRFRKVYEGAEVPGEPTSPDVKIKKKIAAAKKHRMRGPEDLVINGESMASCQRKYGESMAWLHMIKIYDKHPELEGSKVVYALCCHCQVVLKAGTENGTKSLLTHCNTTCIKNKKQQATSSEIA